MGSLCEVGCSEAPRATDRGASLAWRIGSRLLHSAYCQPNQLSYSCTTNRKSGQEEAMSEIMFGTRTQPLKALEEALGVIREKADSVRFGTITLTIHEGRLTQLEVTEKRRFG